VVAACALLGIARAAWAHPTGLSVLTVQVEDRRVRAEMVLPTHALPRLYPQPAGMKDADYAAWAAERLEKDAADVLELRLNYAPVSPASARARVEDESTLFLDMEFPATTPDGGPVTALQVYSNRVPNLGEGHRQLVEVHDGRGTPPDATLSIDGGRVVARHALTAGQFSAFVNIPPLGTASTNPATQPTARSEMLAPPPAPAPAALSFFHLGVEHILTGYDHLLFLAALLLVCRGFGEAAKIITCFTAAHSITLALAALDVVRLSPRIVEPMIAASIVYVAAENLWQSRGAFDSADDPHRVGRRMLITFGFGLVHGLGFASALREAGLGSTPRGLLGPLVQFNLGVEAGQLAVAAFVFPIILALRNRPSLKFDRRWVPACSAVVVAVGGWWLVTRIAAP